MERSSFKAKPESDVTPLTEGKLDFDDDTLRAITEVYKNEGNDQYRKQKFSNAIHYYTEGIKVSCKDDELNAKLYSNRATAHFYLGNYYESLNDAKAAVDLQPNYIKAIARGASACVELHLYEEAVSWCDKGLGIDKRNKLFLKLRSKSVDKEKKIHGAKHEEASDELKSQEETRKDEETGDQSLQGVLLCETVNDYQGHEHVKQSIDYYKLPVTIKEAGDRASEGDAYGNLGNEYLSIGDFRKAVRCFEFCLQIAKEAGNRLKEGRAYSNLGNGYHCLGDFKKAIRYHELYLKIARELNDRFGEGSSYGDLGNCYSSLGDFKKSIRYYELSLEFQKKLGNRAGEGSAYCNLGNAYHGLGDFSKAIQCHKLHQEIAIEMGDVAGEGRAYGNLGNDYRSLGDFKKAISFHERDLEIAKRVGNRAGEGSAYGSLGNAYHYLGDFKKAIHYHELSLKIAKDVGNKVGEGGAYGDLGNDYSKLGDLKKAVQYHELHLKFYKEMGNKAEEAGAYCNLGNDYHSLGDFRKAIHYHELYLEFNTEKGNRAGEGEAYGNLGNAYHNLGDFGKAVHYHELHLNISMEVGDRCGEGTAYGNLGNDFLSLGDFKKAIVHHKLCMKIAKEVRNSAQEENAHGNLGIAYAKLGNLKKSIDCHELQLKIAKEVGDIPGEGRAYGGLGNAYDKLGYHKKAIHYHKCHLKITKKVGNRVGEGAAYGNLARVHQRLGDLKMATQYNKLALETFKEVGDRYNEARTYGNLGNIYNRLGDLTEAIRYHQLHLDIANEVGDKVGEGIAYGNLGNAHAILGDVRKAIAYQQRCLVVAKNAGDRLMEGEMYSNLGANFERIHSPTDAAYCYQSSIRALDDVRVCLQFQDEWKISLRHLYQTVYTSLWRVLLKQGKVVEGLKAAEKGRAQALKDLMARKYALGTSVDDSRTLERTINDPLSRLPSNVVFAAVEERQVIFWLIQEAKEVMIRRREISDDQSVDMATFLHTLVEIAFEKIGVRAGVKCEDRSLALKKNDEHSEDTKCEQNRDNSVYLQSSALKTLYDVIIGPTADLLCGEEVVIVPEGPMWLAPYAAFQNSNSKYLSELFRIRLLPSLTSLQLIANAPDDYHCKSGALLVGDPWVQEIVSLKLLQLPFARKEVEIIGNILGIVPLTGAEATKDEVLKRLSSVALVHIAAHGRMESGEIALAPSPSRTSQEPKDEDFLLSISDVLKVKMRARLVVLSCCHSGRGEIKAEGVVGIARAFMGAGARSVLVSLWAIDDKATQEFMKSFYQYLVEGRSASEALNLAMKCIRESDRFSEVKYWAPFVLIGDDVTLELGGDD